MAADRDVGTPWLVTVDDPDMFSRHDLLVVADGAEAACREGARLAILVDLLGAAGKTSGHKTCGVTPGHLNTGLLALAPEVREAHSRDKGLVAGVAAYATAAPLSGESNDEIWSRIVAGRAADRGGPA